jgi:hypothetical protein
MQKLDKIKDEDLRSRLTEAHQQLRANKPTDAVRSLADTFLWMVKAKPDLLEQSVAARAGRRMPLIMRWPALGANLSRESVEAKDPKIEFVRDHFAMSEAITYFEFTVDTAISQDM